MIPRYEVKEISRIWSDENRFQQFLKVEIALLRALEQKAKIPSGTTETFKNVEIRPARIYEIEETTRHDVIAFCSSITEQVSAEKARFFHFGVTSSDVIDTALSLQLKDSVALLIQDLKGLLSHLKNQVENTKNLICIGRSHGMFAEPMVFAQKFLSFYVEIQRRLRDYQHVLEHEITGQISGAVGNYTVLDAEIESLTLKELGLPVEEVSTQVVPRDHLGLIVSIGALLAAALERMAVEIRLLHHSDVNELYEGFKKGQKGSSAMPHKKNPISSENITGLSRVIRSHVEIALQNCVLWHERDISHSSTERMYLPDHFGLLCYATRRMASTVADLHFNRQHIEAKALNNFSSISGWLLHEMILLNSTTREELYTFIQEASFNSRSSEDFFYLIEKSAAEKGLKVPPSMNTRVFKEHYINRFRDTLKKVLP